MRLSRELHREIENHFRRYFGDETLILPEVEIFVRRGAWLFSRLFAVHGITFGRHVFIRPELVRRNAQNLLTISKNLLVHELTHTMQYRKQGFIGFLYSYFKTYFVNLKGKKDWGIQSRVESYLEIPQEIEARDSAEKFCVFYNSRKSYSSSSSISK